MLKIFYNMYHKLKYSEIFLKVKICKKDIDSISYKTQIFLSPIKEHIFVKNLFLHINLDSSYYI